MYFVLIPTDVDGDPVLEIELVAESIRSDGVEVGFDRLASDLMPFTSLKRGVSPPEVVRVLHLFDETQHPTTTDFLRRELSDDGGMPRVLLIVARRPSGSQLDVAVVGYTADAVGHQGVVVSEGEVFPLRGITYREPPQASPAELLVHWMDRMVRDGAGPPTPEIGDGRLLPLASRVADLADDARRRDVLISLEALMAPLQRLIDGPPVLIDALEEDELRRTLEALRTLSQVPAPDPLVLERLLARAMELGRPHLDLDPLSMRFAEMLTSLGDEDAEADGERLSEVLEAGVAVADEEDPGWRERIEEAAIEGTEILVRDSISKYLPRSVALIAVGVIGVTTPYAGAVIRFVAALWQAVA